MAVISASALPICSPNASPCISVLLWTCVDIFFLFVGSSLLLPPSCVDLQLFVASPVLYGPYSPDWLVQLSVAPPSSCVDLYSDWFVQLSLVLDLTMWPRLLWHHMVPSSARDRPAHAFMPLPANHTPWSKNWRLNRLTVCLHWCSWLMLHNCNN